MEACGIFTRTCGAEEDMPAIHTPAVALVTFNLSAELKEIMLTGGYPWLCAVYLPPCTLPAAQYYFIHLFFTPVILRKDVRWT